MSALKKVIDGWSNVFTGLGTKNRDKRKSMSASWTRDWEPELEDLYATDDTALTIVDDLPDEGTREWIEFKHENEDISKAIRNYFDVNDVVGKFRKAWKWSRLYGGSGILLITKASQDQKDEMLLSTPLKIKEIAKEGGLIGMSVFNRFELEAHEINSNPADPNYGRPESYRLNPRLAYTSGSFFSGQDVHYSRILRFDGRPLGRQNFITNRYWDASFLTETVRDVIADYNTAHSSNVAALQDFSVPVIKMKNLADLFSSGKESIITSRLNTVNMCRSVLRMMVIDEEESFDFVNRTLTGLKESVEKAEDRLLTASKMPRSRLFGESQKGLSNEDKTGERKWYDYVAAEQKRILSPKIDTLIDAIRFSPGLVFKNPAQAENLSWYFVNLWQQTETEKAEVYSKTAVADEKYILNGVLSPSDVRKRFSSEKFNPEITVIEDPEFGGAPPDAEEQVAENQGN